MYKMENDPSGPKIRGPKRGLDQFWSVSSRRGQSGGKRWLEMEGPHTLHLGVHCFSLLILSGDLSGPDLEIGFIIDIPSKIRGQCNICHNRTFHYSRRMHHRNEYAAQ